MTDDGKKLTPANVEVHIIGFDGDLYGQELTVDLLAWIRAERRFDGVDELVAQLRHDVARCAAIRTPELAAP